MTQRPIKIAVTAVVLASAFGFMMWTTLRDGAEYFKHVDEVVAQRAALEGKKVQMHGYVIPGSILNNANTLEWRFKVQNTTNGTGKAVGHEGMLPAQHFVEDQT